MRNTREPFQSLKIITVVLDFLGILSGLFYGLITLGSNYLTSAEIADFGKNNLQAALLIWGVLLMTVPGSIMLILHIIGLINFRRVDYPLTGHILGIIAAVFSIVAILFWLTPFLYLLAGIFLLVARKKGPLIKNEGDSKDNYVGAGKITAADLYPDRTEELPNMDNTVVEIKAYLDSKGIKYKKSSRKSDLLKLIK
ncbi:hypothetical protein [Oenococcus oeni]|uniref:Uncharacterized protein n=2 Tax=Oenococcus oeni TaxID=1247 RepID=A0NL29_OENOE|nr:hypothetical protein [Oenococcus oeni]EAV38700.1 hypothetical protein OENOO_66006 [Oenococcus oeni ATCC BAA-1163]AVI93697.1 hypothetical protein AX764_01975 [Oenococcus oeni]EJO02183.1 hypothetical protein AWRIB418_621 [Oenococcus oeni AWRIB418]KDE87679.1 hypothetical protein EL27_08090 [Oenococcus oeni]KEP88060.1 membrane protein [Oenococcus oeni IOEB_0501]